MTDQKNSEPTAWDSPETMAALEAKLAELGQLFAAATDATGGKGPRGKRAHAVADVLRGLSLALHLDGAEEEGALRAMRAAARGLFAVLDARREPLAILPGEVRVEGDGPVLARSVQALRPRPEALEEIIRILGGTIGELARQHDCEGEDTAQAAVARGVAQSLVVLAWQHGSELAATLTEAGARTTLVTGQYTKQQATWFRNRRVVDPADLHMIYARNEGLAQSSQSFGTDFWSFVRK